MPSSGKISINVGVQRVINLRSKDEASISGEMEVSSNVLDSFFV